MYSERPVLIVLIALVAGCLAEYLLAVPIALLVPTVLLVAVLTAVPFRSRVVFSCLLALFWISWGMAALAPRLDGRSAKAGILSFDGQQVVVEGLLVRRPVVLPEGQRLELQVERVFLRDAAFMADGLLQLTIATGNGSWLTGDRIRCPVKVRVPRLLGLPGEFNYPRYLALRGVDALAWVKEADSVVLIRGASGCSPRRWIDRLALRSQLFIRQTLSDSDQRSVVLALATGGQQEVSPDLAAAYSRAGVSHILSVSGFHVGIVTAVWVFLLRWLLLRWEWLALRVDVRRVALLTSLPIMFLYLLFTGCAPATVRSVLMLSAVVLALWSERQVDTLDALLMAAFLLLLFDPAVLFDLSFQLSFLALWGLLVLTPLLTAPFQRFLKQNWQRSLLLFCAASLAAILATMALVLASFHQVSFTGIPANLVVVPLLGYGATVLATAAVPLLFLFPGLAGLMLHLAGWLVQLSNHFVLWIAGLPVVQSFNVGTADLAATVAVLALISFVTSIRIRVLSCVVLCAGLAVLHCWPEQSHGKTLDMTFLSVGQGDATLISLPDGRTMLVDGGGYLHDHGRDFGTRYLVPALHCLKVKRIDIMVLTHPHPDHLGGLPAVAEQFVVSEFWEAPQAGQGAEYQRLVRALNRQKTALRVLQQGDKPLIDRDLVVTVLSPPDGAQRETAENEDSLVLRLHYGRFSALLMGDAGFPVENRLILRGMEKTTVLKVGHHGSKTATGELFLGAIQPQIAVISAGAGNNFGLPSAETMQRIRQHGTFLYRTDQQGSIHVTSDGNGFTAEPCAAEHKLLAAVRRFVLTGRSLLR